MDNLSYLGPDMVDGLLDREKLSRDIKKLKVSNDELKMVLKATEDRAQILEKKAEATAADEAKFKVAKAKMYENIDKLISIY